MPPRRKGRVQPSRTVSESGIPLFVQHEMLSEQRGPGGVRGAVRAWCVLTAGSLPLQNGQAAPEESGNPPSKVKMQQG